MPVKDLPYSRDIQVAYRSTARSKSRLGALGKLAPAVVGLWMAADLLARFLNPTLLDLDPWLVVSKCPPRYSPFSPNQSFTLTAFVGGNARQANLEPTEVAGPILFSTDPLGFRANPYLGSGQAPEVLFWGGDSFTYGVGLSDNQTLPSVLTARYGIPSYNGGRFHDDPDGVPELDWLLAHLPGRPSTVVYTYLEHRPFVSPNEKTGIQGALLRRYPKLEGDLRYCKLLNTFFWELSPARVVTTRFFKKLSNDRVFPNENTDTVKTLLLPGGQRVLFRDYEYLLSEQDRGPGMVGQTARGFAWLQSELKKRNLNLVVLLMPNRYTLYAPALSHKDAPWTHYLDQLDGELQRRGIRTVNGLAVYRSSIQQEVETGQLSFYREDPHWNSRGVLKIAGPLAEAVSRSLPAKIAGTKRDVIQ